MADHVLDEAKRCFQCKKPFCRLKGCPVQTDIPKMISLYLAGELDEAGAMLFENNPMSVICSIVCDHEAQCEGNCIQHRKGTPIRVSHIENAISDRYLDKLVWQKEAPNGKSVAVIGAGPAGIVVSIKLALRGYDVTIFETMDEIGGMMRYGIPDFRLPTSLLDRYKAKLDELGVHIRPNTFIGETITIDHLFEDGYKSIFIGSGAWKANGVGIDGESLGNCHYAIDYLRHPESYHLGDRVAVIGAGNSAMDAARTALRTGSTHTTIYARRKVIRASKAEFDEAVEDGVQFSLGKGVAAITPEGPLLYDRHFDDDLNLISEDKDSPVLYRADSTILAVSQSPRGRIVGSTKGIEVDEKGLVKTDEEGRTTREGVFAAGDVVIGPMNIVLAVRGAKQAAEAMDAYMKSM